MLVSLPFFLPVEQLNPASKVHHQFPQNPWYYRMSTFTLMYLDDPISIYIFIYIYLYIYIQNIIVQYIDIYVFTIYGCSWSNISHPISAASKTRSRSWTVLQWPTWVTSLMMDLSPQDGIALKNVGKKRRQLQIWEKNWDIEWRFHGAMTRFFQEFCIHSWISMEISFI